MGYSTHPQGTAGEVSHLSTHNNVIAAILNDLRGLNTAHALVRKDLNGDLEELVGSAAGQAPVWDGEKWVPNGDAFQERVRVAVASNSISYGAGLSSWPDVGFSQMRLTTGLALGYEWDAGSVLVFREGARGFRILSPTYSHGLALEEWDDDDNFWREALQRRVHLAVGANSVGYDEPLSAWPDRGFSQMRVTTGTSLGYDFGSGSVLVFREGVRGYRVLSPAYRGGLHIESWDDDDAVWRSGTVQHRAHGTTVGDINYPTGDVTLDLAGTEWWVADDGSTVYAVSDGEAAPANTTAGRLIDPEYLVWATFDTIGSSAPYFVTLDDEGMMAPPGSDPAENRERIQSRIDEPRRGFDIGLPWGSVWPIDSHLAIRRDDMGHPRQWLKLHGVATIAPSDGFASDRLVSLEDANLDENHIVFEGLTLDGRRFAVNGFDWYDTTIPFDRGSTDHPPSGTAYTKAVTLRDANVQRCYRAVRFMGNQLRMFGGVLRNNHCGLFGPRTANDASVFGTAMRRNVIGAEITASHNGRRGGHSWVFSGAIIESNANVGLLLRGAREVSWYGGHMENNGHDLADTRYDGGLSAPSDPCHIWVDDRTLDLPDWPTAAVYLQGPMTTGHDIVYSAIVDTVRGLTVVAHNDPAPLLLRGSLSAVDLTGGWAGKVRCDPAVNFEDHVSVDGVRYSAA